MMNGMVVAPSMIGSECQDACQESECVIGLVGLEEGAMPAVVKDHKDTKEKANGHHRQSKHEPVRYS